jgi:hypothetical protein
MSQQAKKWYSPRLRRALVTKLYFRAKAEGVPMTRLTNRLVEEGLSRISILTGEQITARAAEEPQTPASVP